MRHGSIVSYLHSGFQMIDEIKAVIDTFGSFTCSSPSAAGQHQFRALALGQRPFLDPAYSNVNLRDVDSLWRKSDHYKPPASTTG